MGGLAHYDGYRTQVFDAATRNTPGLPDAYVRTLLALPDGGLLIGTNAGSLIRFDPRDNSFHAYPVGANGTSDGKIYSLADDHAGGMWIATDNGLNHLDLRSERIEHIDSGASTTPRNFSVLQDRVGNVWLGNNEGLFVRYPGTADFVRPGTRDSDVAAVLNNKSGPCMKTARAGSGWAADRTARCTAISTDNGASCRVSAALRARQG